MGGKLIAVQTVRQIRYGYQTHLDYAEASRITLALSCLTLIPTFKIMVLEEMEKAPCSWNRESISQRVGGSICPSNTKVYIFFW